MKNKQALLNKLQEYKQHLESLGHNVVYVGLYGSQNYNLDDEQSDVDARAVVVPSLRDLLLGKQVSTVYEVDGGQVDTKDLVTFVKTLRKGNPAYIESAETEVWVGDQEVRDLIQGFPVKPMAVYGMIMEKFTAIEKGRPKTAPTVAELGYDAKQLHHIERFSLMLLDAAEKRAPMKSFQYLTGKTQERLVLLKRGVGAPSLWSALDSRDTLKATLKSLIEGIPYESPDFPEAVYEYLEEAVKGQLLKEEEEQPVRRTNVATVLFEQGVTGEGETLVSELRKVVIKFISHRDTSKMSSDELIDGIAASPTLAQYLFDLAVEEFGIDLDGDPVEVHTDIKEVEVTSSVAEEQAQVDLELADTPIK